MIKILKTTCKKPYTYYIEELPYPPCPYNACVFKKINYKLHLTIRKTAQHMGTVTDVIDSGAGPNLVSRSFLPTAWRDFVRPAGIVGLRSEAKQTVEV